ncbi:MAG TPA: cyclic nucleotide-binding domain-containing protein, partial [Planctomycetia bacterium]|nr:cyclic nucleotide-binding domain-containing protein [Planctomycetia bacterium]
MGYAYEEESVFARDDDGRLVALREVDRDSFKKTVKVGLVHRGVRYDLDVPLAVPKRDQLGGIVYGVERLGFLDSGRRVAVPVRSTVYDAVRRIGIHNEWAAAENPVPVLCHRRDLDPVGVCRVCCVDVYSERTDKEGKVEKRAEDQADTEKLIPACKQQVENGMVIYTAESGDDDPKSKASRRAARIRRLVGGLVGLLNEKHRFAESPEFDGRYTNELDSLADMVENRWNLSLPFVGQRRDASTKRLDLRQIEPLRSGKQVTKRRFIEVDFNNCIACNRCVRSCNDIKGYRILGRQGKGKNARVGFDLGDDMLESNCVGCGECALSCPVGALTIVNPARAVNVDLQPSTKGKAAVSGEIKKPLAAEELRGVVLRARNPRTGALMEEKLFEQIPFAYLKWNDFQAIERSFTAPTVIAEFGDYGTTAFFILKGEIGVHFPNAEGVVDGKGAPPPAIQTPDNLVVGEMACMTGQKRSARLVARPDAVVLEVGRKFLYQLQRAPAFQKILDEIYRDRALDNFKFDPKASFFGMPKELARECIDFLKSEPDVQLMRFEPEAPICEVGEDADALFIVRMGHVKVLGGSSDEPFVLDYYRAGAVFGELAMAGEWARDVSDLFLPGMKLGKRTAKCVALDHVELVRVPRAAFRRLWERNADPGDLAARRVVTPVQQALSAHCRRLLERHGYLDTQMFRPLDAFVGRGIFQGQKLLVLDLDSCTRCDECTKACIDFHGDGLNRLTRDGDRFDGAAGRYLVATSCRSCNDPVCLVGCPTDAIRRERKSKKIAIDPQACIGCQLCANNCPFGNIKMSSDATGRATAVKAVVCDLCEDVPANRGRRDPGPMCVNACPHDAAHRVHAIP